MKIGLKHIFLLLTIPLLVSFHLAQSSYLHYHHFSDGSFVAHSHPYQNSSNDDGSPKHTHTSSELIILQLFDGTLSSDIQPDTIPDVEITDCDNCKVIHTPHYISLKENTLFLRGPPKYI